MKQSSLVLNLIGLAAGMAMLAYASVPLYRLFCEATGYGGTTRKGAYVQQAALGKTITIEFNADTDPNLPWEFKPGEKTHSIKVGEQGLTYYVARNNSNQPVTGRAVYNVVPHLAGQYFVKIECFCFTEQTLQPKQEVHMPVSFYIDPAIAKDDDLKNVHTITLSYTFFLNK